MSGTYSERYMEAEGFVAYCKNLNVKTDVHELEHYEKTGVMLPAARVIYPDEYAKQIALWPFGKDPNPNLEQWPEVQQLFDRPRPRTEDYAELSDAELIDSFDRAMGHNPYLFRPTVDAYVPWDHYTITIPHDGYEIKHSRVEHYYSYWQVCSAPRNLDTKVSG